MRRKGTEDIPKRKRQGKMGQVFMLVLNHHRRMNATQAAGYLKVQKAGEYMARLTKKQKVFVDEYMIDLNATQAAIRAGYSPESAGDIGCENLKKPNIKSAIAIRMAERSKRTGINADRVVIELAKIAFANPKNVINFSDATVREDAADEDLALITGIKVRTMEGEDGSIVDREVKFADRIKALDLLGKHLGIYQNNVNLKAEIEADKNERLNAIAGILEQMRPVADDEVVGDADG